MRIFMIKKNRQSSANTTPVMIHIFLQMFWVLSSYHAVTTSCLLKENPYLAVPPVL